MRSVISMVAGCVFLAGAASAQENPRTPEGKPDFHGVWDSPWLTPMERTPEITSPTVSGAEAAAFVATRRQFAFASALNVPSPIDYAGTQTLVPIDGAYRTSLITDPPDGRIPYTEAGRAFTTRAFSYDGPETVQLQGRCISGGGPPPMMLLPAESIRQIVQTATHMTIYLEGIYETRIIAVGGHHPPPAVASIQGHSIGRWEEDVFVVETTNYRADTQFRSLGGTRMVLGPGTKVMERFTLSAPDEILYRFTVEDPVLFSRPWSGEYPMKRIAGRAYEAACHEGNYALTNLLRGARMEEARKAARPRQ